MRKKSTYKVRTQHTPKRTQRGLNDKEIGAFVDAIADPRPRGKVRIYERPPRRSRQSGPGPGTPIGSVPAPNMTPASTDLLDAQSIATDVLTRIDQAYPVLWATAPKEAHEVLRSHICLAIRAYLRPGTNIAEAVREANDVDMLRKRISDLEDELVRIEGKN